MNARETYAPENIMGRIRTSSDTAIDATAPASSHASFDATGQNAPLAIPTQTL
ncbi:hypothetical protein [Burkholderia pseudomallei]|uniref:hypothetical protein n=1 Tax=Burkholderia pseudomallei TaxID=28450 RepID=UPI001C722061|nr:hypothetical protein [Burkholderia pseudomallei]